MEIRARVALSLPSIRYKVTLKYDTFEKATYDSFLIASLVKNAKSDEEAFEYIDEITGKGSLNPHFKKLYNEIKKLTPYQIDGIVENSLFPVTVIDQKNHFKYYPIFNASKMNGKIYNKNLKNDEELLKALIMPQEPNIKFLSLDFQEEQSYIKKDNYNAIFSDDSILIDLDNGQYYPMSKEYFENIYENDVDSLDGYLGDVGDKITDGSWNVLSKSIVETFQKANYRYKDSNGNHSVLYGDCVKTIDIIKVFGLYFYKEKKYEFTPSNKAICEDAVEYLMNTKNINEFKTKSLIVLLSSVDEKISQKVVQYILGRKDSKEISELGLKLIKDGLEKGWEHEVLLSIKSQVSSSNYKYLYRLDSDLNFDAEDLISIDDTELTDKDKHRKQKFLLEKDNIYKEINNMIGEITNSGIREKIKPLAKSSLKDVVKKFVDKRIGHSSKNYQNMSMEQIKKEFDEIKNFYDNEYQEILKEIKKNEN